MKRQASAEQSRRFRPSYSGMRIKTGSGSLVSDDLSLNEEQADRAVAALLTRAQTTVKASNAMKSKSA